MTSSRTAPELKVQVKRTFLAPRERVFGAWTEPESLKRWMCRASAEHKAEYLELDVRPGGRYRLKSTSPSGDFFWLTGEYREIRPPEKLVFTWEWTKTPVRPGEVNECGPTIVTVEFFARGDSTEVVLTHEGFTTSALGDRHELGWKGCFETLGRVLQA
ncbi:MAG TPA: SRPBCC domain-containing protein [Candidatus Cybelea sp.]|nr:SRPBCC domain-containing protein [Candidatus Cybelea sp.]